MQNRNRAGMTYVITEVCGESKERFLNMCRHRDILFWDIHWKEDGFVACITRTDFFRLKDICHKTHMRVRIIRKVGVRFLFFRYRARISFVVGCLISFIIVYVCGLYIWDISIEGNTQYTAESLRKYLASEHITTGIPVRNIHCDEIESDLRNAYSHIIWVSVEIRGTRLIVHLKENESDHTQQKEEQGNLVAVHDGVVSSMVTRNGTPQVQVGDTVEQGQVLVSGVVTFHNDAGEEVGEQLVRADADVVLDTTMEYEKQLPHYYQKKGYFKQNIHSFIIQSGTKMVELRLPFSYKGKREEYVLWEQPKWIRLFRLPIQIGKKITKYYDYTEEEYTQEEAASILQRQFQQDLGDLYENGVQILENNVRIEEDVSCYRMKGTMHILMPGVQYAPIEEYDMPDEALTGKRDGESEHS